MKPRRFVLPAALLTVLSLVGPHSAAAGSEVAVLGTLTVQSEDVGAARERLTRVVEGLGGDITTGERETFGPAGRLRSTQVVVRVPANRIDAALIELGGLGIVQDQARATEDLTATIVDVETVVMAQRASIKRVETLLAHGWDRADLAAIRAELRSRRAELTRHERALADLEDRVRTATITVHLVTEPPDPDPPAQPDQPGDVVAFGDDLWWRLGLAILLGLAG